MTKEKKTRPVIPYFRVAVTYNNNEVSAHRIFKDREKAEKYAKKQARSKVVKNAKVVPVDTEDGVDV